MTTKHPLRHPDLRASYSTDVCVRFSPTCSCSSPPRRLFGNETWSDGGSILLT